MFYNGNAEQELTGFKSEPGKKKKHFTSQKILVRLKVISGM